MTAVTLSSIKSYLRIVGTDDDELLGDLIESAEEFTAQYVGEISPSSPASIKQAIRLLVGQFYEHREAVIVGADARQLPLGYWDLIAPHRWPEAAA